VAASLDLLPAEGDGRVIVLITDGENLQGNVDAAVSAIREAGVGALTVVAGTTRGGPIPVPGADGTTHHKRDRNGQPVITRAHPEVLAGIADAVDGEMLDLGDRKVVTELAAVVERLRTREEQANRTVRKVEQFPMFLTSAALMLVGGFLLSPWRRLAVIFAFFGCLAVPVDAQNNAQTAAAPQPPAGLQKEASVQEQTRPLDPPPWWQKWIPGGSRRLARDGVARWREGQLEDSARAFAGAAMLDPEDPERLYDLGTVLGAGGQLEAAIPMLERAHAGGVPHAAYNSGTASLSHQQAEAAVNWLREAVLSDPDDVEAKLNYELALKLLEEQQQQQEQDQEQQEQEQEQEQEQDQQPQATPTPAPGDAPPPTPTPIDNEALYQALERAEAEAREAMRSPTPQAGKVEKDW
jgi:tetratricopeptide (TPR) repeat protein